MKNLKSYDTFNEELNLDTYQKIKGIGLLRGDPRGRRLHNDADMLLKKNAPTLDAFYVNGEKLTVIPLIVTESESGYVIALNAFPWEIVFKGTEGWKTWRAKVDGELVYFDKRGRQSIVNLFDKYGIKVENLVNKIPMI